MPTPIPSPRADASLSSEGPWLVFRTENALWVVNSDGSGLTRLIDLTGYDYDHILSMAASNGRLALVEVESFNAYSPPRLELLNLPDIQVNQLTQLVPEGFTVLQDEDPSRDVYNAVARFSNFDWSPDGSQLAFGGAMDGPSSDLYVYDIAEDQIRRLTSGPTQMLGVNWSPDGEWIVHGGASFFPWEMAGPTFWMEDMWAARADGSEVRRLYDTEDSVGEQVVGWLDDQTFIVTSRDPSAAPFHPDWMLRTFDIETGDVRMLKESHFSSIAMAPGLGKILLGGVEDAILYDPEQDRLRGLTLIDATTGLELIVVEDEARGMRWSSDVNLFLVETNFGILAVSPTGDFIDLAVPKGSVGFPAVSPEGAELVWYGSGLWIGSLTSSLDQPPQQIFAEPVSLAMWEPEGDHLFFFSDEKLYLARSPDFDPTLIADELGDPSSAVWVWR